MKDGAGCHRLWEIHKEGVCDGTRPPCEEEVYRMTASGMYISDAKLAALKEEYGWGLDSFSQNFIYLRGKWAMPALWPREPSWRNVKLSCSRR